MNDSGDGTAQRSWAATATRGEFELSRCQNDEQKAAVESGFWEKSRRSRTDEVLYTMGMAHQ